MNLSFLHSFLYRAARFMDMIASIELARSFICCKLGEVVFQFFLFKIINIQLAKSGSIHNIGIRIHWK